MKNYFIFLDFRNFTAMFLLQLVFILISLSSLECSLCAVRSYGAQRSVCVCNSSYCDTLDSVSDIPIGKAFMFKTNKAGARFEKTLLDFSSQDPDIPTIIIKESKNFQFILGFGGAFTDATGINVMSLPSNMQDDIIKSYFSENGLEYNMGRVPIASCDFSTHPYSYDDVKDDFKLEHFNLTKEDYFFKIPLIKKAASMAKEQLLLFGSPWSSPGWMKTNNAMNGKGGLKGKPGGPYYQAWADYFVRFLKAYKANNITFWGLTTQNEPTDGCLDGFSFQAMCFPPEKQRDFIKLNLGPTLQKSGFGVDNVKLMIMDDARFLLPRFAEVILNDANAAQYVSGIAFHWYYDKISPYKLLDITARKFPGVFFLPSEACTGSYPWDFPKVSLGDWKRAERYAYDIIQDLLNWSIGWIDWNLALDTKGGPNWVNNFVDAPIIVNATGKEFYKQPMFYALAQFSKLLPRGSIRIGVDIVSKTNFSDNVAVAAFKTPQDKIVVIIVNRSDEDLSLNLQDVSIGFLKVTATAHSIQSYIWSQQSKVLLA